MGLRRATQLGMTISLRDPPLEGVQQARAAYYCRTDDECLCTASGGEIHQRLPIRYGASREIAVRSQRLGQMNMNMPQTDQVHRTPEGRSARADYEASTFEDELSRRLHEIDLALWVTRLHVHSNLRWLDREDPDVEAAKRTAAKLVENLNHLENLIRRL